MNTTQTLLREFDFEFPTTRKFLALIPDDKLTWKPHEKSMELGRLAWHLSDFPSWLTSTVTKDEERLGGQDPRRNPRPLRRRPEGRPRKPGRHQRRCMGPALEDGDGRSG